MKPFFRSAALLLALAMAAVPAAAAQQFDRAAFEAKIAQLNLTEAQKQAAWPIITSGLKERADILEKAGIKRGEKPTLQQLLKVRGPIRESRAKTEAQLSAVFNAQQMAGYRKIVDEQREEMRERFK